MKELNKTRLRWSAVTLAGVGVVGAAIVLFLFCGGFDAAADAAWSQPATWLIHRTMVHSVKVRSGSLDPPGRITPAEVQAGFRIYDTHCAMCHGGPGLGRQPWTAGLEPSPPYLIDAARRWSPADLAFIIQHGVKMTGMPGWSSRISTTDTWNVVAFLEALPYLTAKDYAKMRAAAAERQPMPTQPEPEPDPVPTSPPG